MKVEATSKGFFAGEVRNYNEDAKVGDKFTITSRLPVSAKKTDHDADIKSQFSAKWMKELITSTVING